MGGGEIQDLFIPKWSLPIDGGTALPQLSPLKPHASDTKIHSSCRLWQSDFPDALPPRVARDFWRQSKGENTLWQGLGSLWMLMSLGKFTEQLAGSEAPASVTSPPTRHSPRFAKGSKGLQGPYSKSRDTHGNPLTDTQRAPPVTFIFMKMISLLFLHAMHRMAAGLWVLL